MTSTLTTTAAANINTVLHGDCVETMRGMQSASVDFVITDPPYITHYRSRDGRNVANDDNAQWLKPAFAQMHRLLKAAAFCVSFYGWNKADLFIDAWRNAGFRMVGHVVFRKRYPSSTRFLRYQHEQAYVLAKGDVQPPAKPIPDVIEFPYTGNELHPTAKAPRRSQAAHQSLLPRRWHGARPVRRFRLGARRRQAVRAAIHWHRNRRAAPPHGIGSS